MGTPLTGLTPAQTYDGLLKTTDNQPINGTEKALSDGLGNDSVLKVGTASASVQGDFQVTGTVKDSSGQTGALGQVLSSLATGTSWVDVGLEGTSYVIVKGDGTPEENGQALLDGYTEAVSKIETIESIQYFQTEFAQNLGGGNYRWFLPYPGISYPANTNYQATFNGTDYIFNIAAGPQPNTALQVYVTDLGGTPVTNLNFSNQSVPVVSSATYPAFLLIAPGFYTLPSTLVINHRVSVGSLSGERDVKITGDVQVSSGANNTSTLISNLDLGTGKFIVDNNLQSITVKNVFATAEAGWGYGVVISGTFIDCFGGKNSFGSGAGGNASGTFIRCDAHNALSVNQGYGFGSASGSMTGMFYQCGSTSYGYGVEWSGGTNNFGDFGTTLGGYMYQCYGQTQSFGNRTTNNYGRFWYCASSGTQSFGNVNGINEQQCYYCYASSGFGRNSGTSVNAAYYYCVAEGNQESFGSYEDGADYSTYIGCVSRGGASFGKLPFPFGINETRGRLFNCTMGGTFAPLGGGPDAKIINCLETDLSNPATFNLVNLP